MKDFEIKTSEAEESKRIYNAKLEDLEKEIEIKEELYNSISKDIEM